MKGIIFNIVQEVVETAFGVDAWDDVVDHAGVDGAYTSLGSYPDAELVALVAAISERAGVPKSDVLVLTGRSGFGHLAARHGELLDGMATWRDVLHQLDGLIHPEVRKIYADAAVPEFDASDRGGTVLLEYRSARNLCKLAEGLVLGLGDHYGARLVVDHLSCTARGDDVCHLEVAAQ